MSDNNINRGGGPVSGSGWQQVGPGRWRMGGDSSSDRAGATEPSASPSSRSDRPDRSDFRRRWDDDDFGSGRSERSERWSGGFFSSNKRAAESLGKDGPVAGTQTLKSRVAQAVAPASPRLFAGAQVKFKDKAEVFTFVGYSSQGGTLLRSASGSEQTVRDASQLELLPNQSFRSVLETMTPNGKLFTARPEQVAEFNRMLARKVGSGDGTVREVVDAIRDAGFEAFIVGGAVRDMFLGKPPRDVDLATSMWVEDVRGAAEKRKLPTGRTITQFGTIKVGWGSNELDVVTLKRASGEFGLSLAEDVRYRDFSINQLFYDPSSTLIADPTGYGVSDVLSKTLRPAALPGQEQQWLRDNPSAAVRLFKFTLRGFTPTPELLQLVKDNFTSCVRKMEGLRRSAMLDSVGASRDEITREMRRLGFTDEHIQALYPSERRWSDRDDDEGGSSRPWRPWRSSNDDRSESGGSGGPTGSSSRGGSNFNSGASSSTRGSTRTGMPTSRPASDAGRGSSAPRPSGASGLGGSTPPRPSSASSEPPVRPTGASIPVPPPGLPELSPEDYMGFRVPARREETRPTQSLLGSRLTGSEDVSADDPGVWEGYY